MTISKGGKIPIEKILLNFGNVNVKSAMKYFIQHLKIYRKLNHADVQGVIKMLIRKLVINMEDYLS